ncbi:MAG: hypothetical protein Q6L50_04995 [Gloeomargarita sp. GMQP_bins_120]
MLLAYLDPQQRDFLQRLGQQVAALGGQAYLVGGGVRDLLLAQQDGQTITLADLDLVLDHLPPTAIDALAEQIRRWRPGALVQPHPKFFTCDILWPDLALDLALARRETYPHPAANPVVTPADIHQDLYRRDFTINAMALGLHPEGVFLDPFDGRGDLQRRLLRVLHDQSFTDDPTRLWRGVRYGVRYGLQLAPETLAQWQDTLASGVLEYWRRQPGQAPALQTRLRAELQYLWQMESWVRAGRWLEALGAWACVHPDLHWTPELEQSLRTASYVLRRHPQRHRCLTELLVSDVPAHDRYAVAHGLDLPWAAQKRLARLAQLEAQLPALPGLPVSQICQTLEPYEPELLTLALFRQRGTLRQLLRNYLQYWSHEHPPLNGKDLQALGYAPGPQFRQILNRLRSAYLDREITDRAEAIAYVQRHFPRA